MRPRRDSGVGWDLGPGMPGRGPRGPGGRQALITSLCDRVQQFTCLFSSRLLLYMTMS